MKRTKLGTRLVVKRKIQSLEKLRVVGVSGGRNLEKEAFFFFTKEKERLRFAIVLEKLSLLFRELKKFQHRESVVRKKKKKWKRKRVREKLNVGRDPSSKCIT